MKIFSKYNSKLLLNVLYGNKILGCFARSYDESHKKSNRIHLVSSVLNLSHEYEVEREEYLRTQFLREQGISVENVNVFLGCDQTDVLEIVKENSFLSDVKRLITEFNEGRFR